MSEMKPKVSGRCWLLAGADLCKPDVTFLAGAPNPRSEAEGRERGEHTLGTAPPKSNGYGDVALEDV